MGSDITAIVRQQILAEYLPGTPGEELEASYDLIENGVVDSLALLQLIGWVEQRFQLSTDDVEISVDDFRSIAAIRNFVNKARRERGGSE